MSYSPTLGWFKYLLNNLELVFNSRILSNSRANLWALNGCKLVCPITFSCLTQHKRVCLVSFPRLTHMPEEISWWIPEDSVKAEHDFVEVPVAQALDRLHLPLGKGRAERHRVGKTLGILSNGLLQDAWEIEQGENIFTRLSGFSLGFFCLNWYPAGLWAEWKF